VLLCLIGDGAWLRFVLSDSHLVDSAGEGALLQLVREYCWMSPHSKIPMATAGHSSERNAIVPRPLLTSPTVWRGFNETGNGLPD
jgi:hypothetical protein